MIPFPFQAGGFGLILPEAAGGGGDPDFANVSSLLHFNGADASTTFTDVKSLVWTPGGSAQIDTAQSVFGGASGLFTGTSAYITTPDTAALQMESGDFSIEFRQRYSSKTGFRTIMSKGYGLTGGWLLQTGSGDGRLNFYEGSGATLVASESSGTVNANQWYAIQISRSGSTLRIFRNGTIVASGTSGENFNDTNEFAIGGGNSSLDYTAFPFKGWLDEFRVTKGIARNTANYTPPAVAFPDS